jgi:hypothetical protein
MYNGHSVGLNSTCHVAWRIQKHRIPGLQEQEQYHHYPQYQQQSQSISIPPPATQDISSSQPMNTTNNQGILSQETMLKIQELKRLVYSEFIKSIIYFCNDGNNTFLDEKLEELRMINNIVR